MSWLKVEQREKNTTSVERPFLSSNGKDVKSQYFMCLFANIYSHCIISWINKNILKKDQKMGREMRSVKPVPSKDK